MTILGGFLGGVVAIRIGVMRFLFLGAVLAAVSNLLFIVLAETGKSEWMLYWVIAVDNLAAGLAGAAFIAFLSGLTSLSFTAMQYAIFSSLMTLLPKVIGGYSGCKQYHFIQQLLPLYLVAGVFAGQTDFARCVDDSMPG